jgi:hypothetical protein
MLETLTAMHTMIPMTSKAAAYGWDAVACYYAARGCDEWPFGRIMFRIGFWTVIPLAAVYHLFAAIELAELAAG